MALKKVPAKSARVKKDKRAVVAAKAVATVGRVPALMAGD